MILLQQKSPAVSARALSSFAAKAQRLIGIGGEVSIRITSNRELQRLNRQFRSTNKPTDVLSFPSGMPELAGDIAISADIATANAADLGHPVETELKVLILHGLLHLAGYDHEKDKGDMQAREKQLRRQFRLPLGLIERANSDHQRHTDAAGASGFRNHQGARP